MAAKPKTISTARKVPVTASEKAAASKGKTPAKAATVKPKTKAAPVTKAPAKKAPKPVAKKKKA